MKPNKHVQKYRGYREPWDKPKSKQEMNAEYRAKLKQEMIKLKGGEK